MVVESMDRALLFYNEYIGVLGGWSGMGMGGADGLDFQLAWLFTRPGHVGSLRGKRVAGRLQGLLGFMECALCVQVELHTWVYL